MLPVVPVDPVAPVEPVAPFEPARFEAPLVVDGVDVVEVDVLPGADGGGVGVVTVGVVTVGVVTACTDGVVTDVGVVTAEPADAHLAFALVSRASTLDSRFWMRAIRAASALARLVRPAALALDSRASIVGNRALTLRSTLATRASILGSREQTNDAVALLAVPAPSGVDAAPARPATPSVSAPATAVPAMSARTMGPPCMTR